MAEHEDKNGYKWWQKVLLAIGIFIDVVGVGLFLFSFQYGTKTTDYTIKKEVLAPLQGKISLALAGQRLYTFSEYNCSLNVFDANNGDFCYSLSVPIHQNGEAAFCIRDDYIYIWDRNGTLYKYSLDGVFIGRLYFDYSRTERDYLYLTDAEDKLLATIPTGTDKTPYYGLAFDEDVIQYDALDNENKKSIIVSYNYLKNEESCWEYVQAGSDPYLTPVSVLDGEVIIPTMGPLYDREGHVFTILFGKLCKDDQVIFKTSWLNWIKGYPLTGWCIAAVGTGITAIITACHKKKLAKKEKAKSTELLRRYLPKQTEADES